MIQNKTDPLARKLLSSMSEKNLQPSLRVDIIQTIIHSDDEDRTTEKILKILDTSKREKEIIEKIKKL